jgi:uncharacterized protein
LFVLILVASLLIYGSLVFYIGWSGWRWIKPKSSKLKLLYIIVLIVSASSFIIGRFTENVVMNFIGAYWMAIFYLCIVLLPLAQISVLLLRLTRLPRHRTEKLAGTTSFVLIVALLVYGSFNAYSPVVRSYDVHIPKFNPASPSMKIVMAADMHFGLLSGKDHAARLVREINAIQPDLVLFPGDIVDDEIRTFVEHGIDQTLSNINARYGVYASLGNHDKHRGQMQQLIDTIEASGIKVLYDEAITIEDSVTLIGRKDRSDRPRAELASLTSGLDSSKPWILLEHQPYELDIAQQQGIDLMVSGHTHRGQVFPGNLITDRIYEIDWGYLQKQQLHAIVTSGFGFWGPPIRIGSRSELIQINITFGP